MSNLNVFLEILTFLFNMERMKNVTKVPYFNSVSFSITLIEQNRSGCYLR